jgi:hypothetical protein
MEVGGGGITTEYRKELNKGRAFLVVEKKMQWQCNIFITTQIVALDNGSMAADGIRT